MNKYLSILLIGISLSILAFNLKLHLKTDVTDSHYFAPLTHERLNRAIKSEIVILDQTRKQNLANILAVRNPRHSFARAILTDIRLGKGDLSVLEEHFFPLLSLNKSKEEGLISLLVQSSTEARFAHHILAYVERKKPIWGQSYLLALSKAKVQPLSELLPALKLYPEAHQDFIMDLYKRDGAQKAYAFMTELKGPIKELGSTPQQLIIDPLFSMAQATLPFGWDLQSETITSEANSGVSLFFLGKDRQVFFKQLIKAPAGSYKLSIELDGDASEEKGYFSIDLQCQNQSPVGTFPLKRISPNQETIEFDVHHDQSCDFLWLHFSGEPGTFPSPVSLKINRLTLSPDALKG